MTRIANTRSRVILRMKYKHTLRNSQYRTDESAIQLTDSPIRKLNHIPTMNLLAIRESD